MSIADGIEEREVAESPSPAGSLSALVVDASCFSLPYDYSLCDALGRNGCAVTLVRSDSQHTPWPSPTSFQVWNHFYPRSHARSASGSRGPFWKLGKLIEHSAGMSGLLRECEIRRPDIIHFQWLPVPLIDRRYLARFRRIAPLVLTLHNTTSFHGSRAQRLHQEIGFDSIFQHLSALIVHTEFSRRTVIERGWLPAEKVHVVPHGVLDYYRSGQPASASPARQEQVVLFFGAIEPYKGVDLLIRAFAGLPPSLRGSSRLCIAGKPGMEMRGLHELVSSSGIEDRTTWISRFIDEAEIPGLFRCAAVVALPYRKIDQSGVLMTAIAFDKPIVAARVGGLAETIQDKIHGRLFPPGDVPALTAALEEVLSQPEQRREMEKAVGELRHSFSWENSARRTMDVYSSLVASL